MRTGGVLNLLGKLLLLLSIFLLSPIPFSLYYQDGMSNIFLFCSLVGALLGGGLVFLTALSNFVVSPVKQYFSPAL